MLLSKLEKKVKKVLFSYFQVRGTALDKIRLSNEKNTVSRHSIPNEELETWSDFCRTCGQISSDNGIGKVVGPNRYLHESVLEFYAVSRIDVDLLWRSYGSSSLMWNVVRVDLSKPSVSLLSYPEFDTTGHPELLFSITAQLSSRQLSVTDYQTRFNKPILHRKELLVVSHDENYSKYRMLTVSEDAAGLLAVSRSIGYSKQWNQLLTERNCWIDGHTLKNRADYAN